MVSFPWKQKIKSGQPLDKNSWSASSRAAKSSEAVQTKKKTIDKSRGGSVLVFARQGKGSALLCFKFSSNKKSENLSIYKENSKPWATVWFAGKDKTCRHFLFQPSNVLSAWGRARHFLSTGHVIARWVPGKQREEEHHHTKPGGGAARRGRWLGLLRGLWVLEIMTEIISWRFI